MLDGLMEEYQLAVRELLNNRPDSPYPLMVKIVTLESELRRRNFEKWEWEKHND